MDIDYTKRPVGSFYGGTNPRSVLCRACGKPGLLRKAKPLSLDGEHYTELTYVHGATLKLGSDNEPQLVYGPECRTMLKGYHKE